MRSKIIPAQITTVEDKIAGNLSFNQILILMVPVLVGTVVYTVLPRPMQLAWYKLVLTLITIIACVVLSWRIQGKIVAQWLIILLRFNIRPKYYVFNKNDNYLRENPITNSESEKVAEEAPENYQIVHESPVDITDTLRFDELIRKQKLKLRFVPNKKGGLRVAFE